MRGIARTVPAGPASPADPAVPSALSKAYVARLAFGLTLAVSVATAAFIITFIRPFFTGFDLNSLAREEGVRPAVFSALEGAQVQNQFLGVSAYFFDGPLAGSRATLDRIEQVLGADQPNLSGLAILGQSQALGGLALAELRPSADGQYLEASQGVSGTYAGNEIDADSVRFDPATGILTTIGPTRIVNGAFEIETDRGAQISRNGNVQIGSDIDFLSTSEEQ